VTDDRGRLLEWPLSGFEDRAMGSRLRLMVAGPGPARDAWREVREEFEVAEEAMSRFRDTSELTELNRTARSGRMVVVSRRLRTALAAAERARRLTGGRFDPRVLRDLDRLGYAGSPLGLDDEARDTIRENRQVAAIRRSGRQEVGIDDPIDLGGIGKGLALRWAAARLDRLGMTDYLIEAGGDLVARGRPPDADAWIVGIERPDGEPDPLAAVVVQHCGGAVATSSIRVHQWATDGREVHHLLDPALGEPADSGLLSVTVAAGDPAWAEVWSKALFLAGSRSIADEARQRGMAAWWVDASGVLAMTPAARLRTAWVAAEG